MRWFKLDFEGRRIPVWALKSQGKMWLHFEGETHVLDLSTSGRKAGSSANVATGQCLAPMPGKITKVLVKAGDKVEIGQSLIVMEAMKMEYTLEADLVGKVEEVRVSEGDQVPLGQLLAKVVAK